ncbi:lipopolysaccharide biosynthesis protein [Alicyclobacillus ferrooxydans]|uniref:Polysaccharide biosynthesis protein C-terminal domain-containing protein n=1 Tax=Alicyclobacillus ferrooxydans TaxID=471514 RepID=A0A0P9EL79_9BACL|nr:lipopolysaccharide biosynthesis protein [Alicyclobacillus ferrooxydans]KPV39322.1 hypothetical protein AN477_22765 [Alicyclobacillus ferrooxydans]
MGALKFSLNRTGEKGKVSFLLQTMQTFLSMFMVLGINVVSAIALSRGLTAQDRGLYVEVMMWSNFILGLCDIGIYDATVYLWASSEQVRRRDVFSTMMLWAIFTGVIALTAVELLSMHVLKGHYTHGQTIAAHIYYISSCLGPIAAVFNGILNAEQRFSLANFVRVAVPATLTATWVVLFAVHALSIVACLYTGAVVSVASALPFLWPLRLYIAKPGRISGRILKTGVWYSLKGYGGSLILNFSGNANQMILFSALSPSALAYFQTANSATGVLWTVPNSIAMTTFPQMIGDDAEALHMRVCNYMRKSTMVVTGFALLLGLAEPYLIPLLFGHNYSPAIVPAILLLPNAIFGGLIVLLANALSSTGRTLHNTVGSAIGVGTTLLFMALTVHTWGLVGAALAAVVGRITDLCVRYVWYHVTVHRISVLDMIPRVVDMAAVFSHLRKNSKVLVRRNLG